ncbi:MAG: hypothetical protein JNM84_13015 [Planctomycetes bacterium]|nr:hypothetical protein [Planctomycetota bacterium]
MHLRTFPALIPALALHLGCAALASGQSTVPGSASSFGVEVGARPLVIPSFPAFEHLLFDTDESGAIWVRGSNWKASFDERGATFVPFFGSRAPRSFPISFELAEAQIGGAHLPLDRAGSARREGACIATDRGPLTEIYRLSLDAIEQRFVLEERMGAGALEIAIAVSTELSWRALADGGFAFENEHGAVHYGRAEAFDADGRRTRVQSAWKDGRIVLSVPAEFVAAATYPLTVDPIVAAMTLGNPQIPGSANNLWSNADIAYDAGTDLYVFAMEHAYSATDHDIYVHAFDSSGAPLGRYETIDYTTSKWTEPKIASNRLTGSFLVVAERTLSGGATVIAGRMVPGAVPLVPQPVFQISGAEGGRNPDVGGDPGVMAPTHFCVCWEGGFNGFSNIYYNVVQTNGTLMLPQSVLLGFAPTVTFDTRPSISKSNGNGSSGTQTWIIVFERVAPGGDKDIYGAMIHWDGAIVDQGFAIDTTPASTTAPAVSSPTDDVGGVRKWMVVHQATQGRPPFSNLHEDLHAKVYYGTSPQPVPAISSSLSSIFPSAPFTYDELDPCVDTDGCRFVVGFTEYVSPFYFDQGTPCLVTLHTEYDISIAQTEYPVALSSNPGVDGRLQITSNYSGGGARHRYLATWDAENTGNGHTTIEATLWDGLSDAVSAGASSYFNVAVPGCGGLTLQATGLPALADSFTLTLSNVQSVPFLLIGFSMPPLELCSGCWLGIDPFSATTLQTDTLTVNVPCIGELVNQQFAFQGVDFGLGSGCPGAVSFSLSEEIIVTIL